MSGRHLAMPAGSGEATRALHLEADTAGLARARRIFEVDMLAVEYHGHFSRGLDVRPLTAASRDEWVARFRALVGPDGHRFDGWPGPDHVITLWRGTQYPEHRNGLSWTANRAVAVRYAGMGSGAGQVWRIDAVPMSAILYRESFLPILSEFLIDTSGMGIIRDDDQRTDHKA